MSTKSYTILSNQNATHPNLKRIIEKHASTSYLKPIPAFARAEYNRLLEFVKQNDKPIILDSCCGKADSSIYLAKKFPDYLIIGIDRSAKRLEARQENIIQLYPNILLLRANCEDLWALLLESQVKIAKHFIFYPNPYPKSCDFKKRWHGHPIFPTLLKLCPDLEIRSDWKLYLEEFQEALKILNYNSNSNSQIQKLDPMNEPVSAFEKKYFETGREAFSLKLL